MHDRTHGGDPDRSVRGDARAPRRRLAVATLVLVALLGIGAVGNVASAGVAAGGDADSVASPPPAQVAAGPTARLTHAPAVPETGTLVAFDASDSTDQNGEIVAYGWDFDGDGRVDANTSDPFATHRYATPGVYRAAVTVFDDDGLTDRTTVAVRVNDPPTPTFRYEPRPPIVGEPVTFDATESFDTDGDVVGYAWNFDDDGGTDATGAVVTRTFGRTGDRAVTLTVTDDDGATRSAYRILDVVRRPDPVREPPTAAFEHAPPDPRAGEPVVFDASESVDPDGDIERYVWNFGDGSDPVTADDPVQSHVFAEPGDYLVTLSVTDADGETDTVRRGVPVEAPTPAVEARFDHDPTAPVTGQLVRFDATPSTIPDWASATYLWDFDGDGRVDAESPVPRVGHTFEEFGQFRTTLTVVLETGERASDWTRIEVRAPPEAAFSHEPRRVVAGASVRFDASDSTDPDGDVVAYAWDFDEDGRVDAGGPVAIHTFDTEGRGTVSLVVTDDDGLRDRAELRVVRAPAPDSVPDSPLLIAAVVATGAAAGFAVVTGSLGTLARQISGDETGRNDDGREESAIRVDRVSVLESPDEGLSREFVELRNVSDGEYDLAGATVADDEDHLYEVPEGVSLAPDETVRIVTGTGPPVSGTHYWGREESVWDAAGDRVVVRDADGDVLDEVRYGDRDGA